jgi:peptidoglycan/LPS O-acetylase OafA/YrhL
MKFRFDINALRAIAVIGVIGFHYNLKAFLGGFSGVDIFFVISGYLMSRIIIEGINENKFSILAFYGNRLKRIAPALLFLVLVVSAISFFIYFPNDYKLNEENAAASLLFISNFLFWKSTAYFENGFSSNTFLHTWSLSVEWQFYLLYPLALLLFYKVIKKRSLFLAGYTALTLLICFLSIAYTPFHENTSFYFLPTRCWEMMFGGIAFLVEGGVQRFKYRRIISVFGYIGVLSCIVFLNKNEAWPGFFTLFPVVSTFLVIVANCNEYQLLKFKGIQFVGKISYSLYLWHWPVYIIATYAEAQKSRVLNFIEILISFILGYISFKFVESIKFKNNKQIIIISIAVVVCTVSLSFINSNNFMFKVNSVKVEDHWQGYLDERIEQFHGCGCFLTSDGSGLKDINKQLCLSFKENKKNIIIIGDSHTADIAAALRERFKKNNINLLEASASGCLPVLNPNGKFRCTELINYIYKDFIPKNKNGIDGIILSADWIRSDVDTSSLLTDIKRTIMYISGERIPIIIIGQSETYAFPYPVIAARSIEYNAYDSNHYINPAPYIVNKFLGKQLKQYYIDIYNFDPSRRLSVNYVPYMFDNNHFTKYGSGLIADRILSDSITANFIVKINK